MEQLKVLVENLDNLLRDNSLYPATVIKGAVVIATAIIAWFIIRWILRTIEKKSKTIELLHLKTEYFKLIRRIVRYALILLTGTYLINLFNIIALEKVFDAFLVFLVARPVKELFIIVLIYLEEKIGHETETRFVDILIELLKKFAGALFYSAAAIIALDILGVNVMPFIAGAGVAGIAIGFAAKDTLSNLIAGILLIIDRPFEIGDRIEVWSAPAGTASWGDVIDIGLRATRIKTTDNIIIIIPNNEIMKRDIVNYTTNNNNIRVRINIGIAYDADIATAKQIIIRVAGAMHWVLKNPPPKVVVRNFGESAVDLQARLWIKNARKRMDTISFMTDQVKAEFDQAGIEIPFPRRDITLIQTVSPNHRPAPASGNRSAATGLKKSTKEDIDEG